MRAGQTIGRYRIESTIGQGGFATVFRAVDTVLERAVALKVLDPRAHQDPTTGRRFIHEGQAVASLDHPAIVPVYDAGEDDDVLWMAMRLVDGGSLDQALVAGRRFDPGDTVAVVRRIASALDHAHGQGLFHRDVKPSNILLQGGEPEAAWLTDFGIAATARTMGRYTIGALGTAAYMAPEQARPNQAGPPADLYSLACVAYELLTGRRPFPGDDYVELLMAHASRPVPATGDPGLDRFMARALAKDPRQRPADGRSLANELSTAVGAGLPPTAPAATPPAAAPPAAAPPAAPAAGAESPGRPPPQGPVGPPPAGPAPDVPAGADDPPSFGEAPTVAERPPHTAVNPHQHPMTQGAPPVGGPLTAAPPARDPTVARIARARSVRVLVAGAVLLAAVAIGVMLSRRAGVQEITDQAGAVYEVPSSWEATGQPGRTTLQEGDRTVASLQHASFAGSDAAQGLLGATACGGAEPEPIQPMEGGRSAATCEASGATVLGAVANGELWIVSVDADVSGEDRDRLLSSLRFFPPGS